jgi:O-antigen/teichoic acid export membrane protein
MAGGAALLGWGLFTLVGERLILLSVGAAYTASYPIAVWYMLAVVIAIGTFSFTPSILAMGLPRLSLKILVVATVAYLVALGPLVATWGIVGAPVAYVFFYLVWATLTTGFLLSRTARELREGVARG